MTGSEPPIRVLYLVVCAAPPARSVHVMVDLAQHAAWDVCVIATPSVCRWLDVPALVERTGHPVRSQYKMLGEPDVLPAADAMIVAPATVNTINKWAAGICDTLALGLVCEAIGLGLPIVAFPYSNEAHFKHPAFAESITRLRACGVRVLFGPEALPAHEPRQGTGELPWQLTLAALEDLWSQRASATAEHRRSPE